MSHTALAKTEMIYTKNVRAKVAMDFTYDKYPAPSSADLANLAQF